MRGEASPSRLRHWVGTAIQRHALWSAGDRVAVAVSGGLDSTALLDLLVETAPWHGARLSVVTIDHGTRPGSDADAQFVMEQAGRLGLGAVRCDLHLPADASEEVMRDARYRVLGALDVDRVALGHHREDQAETVLANLLRGAGSHGLSGMSWRRDRYVRPLLEVSRSDLRAYAEQRGLTWREDPTNGELKALRNRLRHQVLPLLEDLRPGASASLARAAALLAEDDRALTALVPALDERGVSIAWLQAAPVALASRAVLALAPVASASAVAAALEAAWAGAGRVELAGGAALVVCDGWLLLEKSS